MGADYYAYVCNGICLKKENFVIKTKNPLFGKYKFDPDTGKKVGEYIEESIEDPDDISDMWNLDRYGLSVVSSTDSKYIFIGKASSDVDISSGDHYKELPGMLTETEMENLLKICKEHNIDKTKEDIKIYVVGCCSY